MQITPGIVIRGHGVASGSGGDARYPEGTLTLQVPHFTDHGIDLSPYFMGTVNVDIAPYRFEVVRPRYFVKDIRWTEHIPAENFMFFDVTLRLNAQSYSGLIYMPDPLTKTDHFQQPTMIECLLPWIEGLGYDDRVELLTHNAQIHIRND